MWMLLEGLFLSIIIRRDVEYDVKAVLRNEGAWGNTADVEAPTEDGQ